MPKSLAPQIATVVVDGALALRWLPGPPGALEAMRACHVEVGGETLAILSVPEFLPGASEPLTAGERDVAGRILRGQTDREMAEARGSSPTTVNHQVSSVFVKLGVESRPQLAERLAPRLVRLEPYEPDGEESATG